MKVLNVIKVHEIDGNEVEEKHLLVVSHDINSTLVSLSVDEEEHFVTVDAVELFKAIKNATNH